MKKETSVELEVLKSYLASLGLKYELITLFPDYYCVEWLDKKGMKKRTYQGDILLNKDNELIAPQIEESAISNGDHRFYLNYLTGYRPCQGIGN